MILEKIVMNYGSWCYKKRFFKLFLNQVMMQPHNRRMPFSLYISALAVSDTVVLLNGEFIFLPEDFSMLCHPWVSDFFPHKVKRSQLKPSKVRLN